jgi:threonine aldolase
MASRLRAALSAMGVSFLADSPTNQLFPILPAAAVDALEQRYGFHRWQPMADGRIAIRLVTSWATKAEAVDDFIASARAALSPSTPALVEG